MRRKPAAGSRDGQGTRTARGVADKPEKEAARGAPGGGMPDMGGMM